MTQIKPEDLIIQTYSEQPFSSWVAHTDKGIKLYHKPSGIEVAIDSERSQHKNRLICMVVLEDLLTPFKEGDIVVTRYGLGQIIHTYAEDCMFMLGDDTARLQLFKSIAHTEEGYKYKTEKWIKEALDVLEQEYDSKRKQLVDMLRSL